MGVIDGKTFRGRQNRPRPTQNRLGWAQNRPRLVKIGRGGAEADFGRKAPKLQKTRKFHFFFSQNPAILGAIDGKTSRGRQNRPRPTQNLLGWAQNRPRPVKIGRGGAEADCDSNCSQNWSRAPKSGEILLNQVQNWVRIPQSGEPVWAP